MYRKEAGNLCTATQNSHSKQFDRSPSSHTPVVVVVVFYIVSNMWLCALIQSINKHTIYLTILSGILHRSSRISTETKQKSLVFFVHQINDHPTKLALQLNCALIQSFQCLFCLVIYEAYLSDCRRLNDTKTPVVKISRFLLGLHIFTQELGFSIFFSLSLSYGRLH